MFNFLKDIIRLNRNSERVIVFFTILLVFSIIAPKSSKQLVKAFNIITGSIFSSIGNISMSHIFSMINLLTIFLVFILIYAFYWEFIRDREYISIRVLNEYLYYHTIAFISILIFINIKYGSNALFEYISQNIVSLSTLFILISSIVSFLMCLNIFTGLFKLERYTYK